MGPVGFENEVAFVWKVADKLRGTFKQHEYGSVMLPLLVLRRMDAVLEPTKDAVVSQAAGMRDIGEGQDAVLKAVARQRFYNTSPSTFASTLSDDKFLAEQLAGYIRRLSADAYVVMEAYDVDDKIARMDRAGILYAVLSDFADLFFSTGSPASTTSGRSTVTRWKPKASRSRTLTRRSSTNLPPS